MSLFVRRELKSNFPVLYAAYISVEGSAVAVFPESWEF
jgi:hypothetical protein